MGPKTQWQINLHPLLPLSGITFLQALQEDSIFRHLHWVGTAQGKLLAWDEVICEVTLSFRKIRARYITSCHAIDFGRGDTPSNRCSLVELQSPLMTLLAIQDAVPILRESDRAIV